MIEEGKKRQQDILKDLFKRQKEAEKEERKLFASNAISNKIDDKHC